MPLSRVLSFRYLLALVLVAGLMGSCTALMIPLTYPEMVQQSDSVIIGTVTDVRSAWNNDHTRIETSVELAVDEGVHGKAVKDRITVVVEGGTAEGITEWVEDEPAFFPTTKGRKVGLFLKPAPDGVRYRISGARQGVALLTEYASPANPKDIDGLTIESFKKKVRAAVEGKTTAEDAPASGGSNSMVESVSLVTPSTASAGTQTLITITGSGFGTKASRTSNADVAFSYRGDQPIWASGRPYSIYCQNDIISWTNTQIVVRVPTGVCPDGYPGSASSGWVKVYNDNNQLVGSAPFAVPFGVGRGTYDPDAISPDKLWYWDGAYPIVDYYINPSGVSNAADAVERAAESWNAVGQKSFILDYVGSTAATDITQNGKSEVVWAYISEPSIIAQAATFRESTSGHTLECDIRFSTQFSWSNKPSSGQVDIETIALHELGHWLQLRDLYGNLAGYPQDTAKVMYGYSGTGLLKRTLHPDDQAGIRWLYPRSVTVTSPNGGETWSGGTTHAITWSQTGLSGTTANIALFKREYLPGPVPGYVYIHNQDIATGVSANAGSYIWTVPTALSDGMYQVRVNSSLSRSIEDYSDAGFTIGVANPTPSITVTSPNAGASVPQGQSYTIRWIYTGSVAPTVKIAVMKGTSVVKVLTTSTPLGSDGAGSFVWNVDSAMPVGTGYTVMVKTTDNARSGSSDAFSIVSSSGVSSTITVTSPNGGETWSRGTVHPITWTYTGTPGSSVAIMLLRGSSVVATLTSSTPIGSGFYSWTVPAGQALGSDYTIGVKSTTQTTIKDTSDTAFAIVAPQPQASITVAAPDGGETWAPGSAQTIRWTSTGTVGSTVAIELLKAGSLNRVIASNVATAAGSYAWTVPVAQTAGSDYAVRITTSIPTVTDTSNSFFSIGTGPVPAAITVTAPNGGESITRGQPSTITWTYTGNPGTNVKIGLFKGTSLVETITTSTPIGSSGTGSFSWPVKSTYALGSDYKITVKSATDATKSDSSDSFFSIVGTPVQPSITVTSPNGGESWVAGSVQTIRWSFAGTVGSTVRVELLKGGLVSSVLAVNAPAGADGLGSLSWPIPAAQTLGTDYSVRVTSTTNAAYMDASNGNFAITAGTTAPTITVTAPDGGETWARGSTHQVTWTYTGSPGSTVYVMLLKGSGSSIISTYTVPLGGSGSGSYSWTIPASIAAGTDYRIGVKSTTQTAIKDTSNSYFRIT